MSSAKNGSGEMNGSSSSTLTAEDLAVFNKFTNWREPRARQVKGQSMEANIAPAVESAVSLTKSPTPGPVAKPMSKASVSASKTTTSSNARKPAQKSAAVASKKASTSESVSQPTVSVTGKRVSSIRALSATKQLDSMNTATSSASVKAEVSSAKRTSKSSASSSPALPSADTAPSTPKSKVPKKSTAKYTSALTADVKSNAKKRAHDDASSAPVVSTATTTTTASSTSTTSTSLTSTAAAAKSAKSAAKSTSVKLTASASAAAASEKGEPAKKKRKLVDGEVDAADGANGVKLETVAIEPVKVEVPCVLREEGGVYKWRESDCEEARCYEFSRVWYSQPEHFDAWKDEGKSLEIQKERSYGEVTLQGMLCLFSELNLSKKDVFVDIGSGLGNLVMFASFVKGAKKSYGVEIQHNRHVAAQHIRDDLAMLRKPYFDERSTQFVYTTQSDLNDCPGIESILKEATVVFCNNILFNSRTMRACIKTFLDYCTDTIFVFTSDPWPRRVRPKEDAQLNTQQKKIAPLAFWKSIEVNDACSWCSKNLKFYFYTNVKRTEAPHFVYNALPMHADSWVEDPMEKDSPAASSSSNSGINPTPVSNRPASRFISKHATIQVSHDSRIKAKELRRRGWISFEDATQVDHSLSKAIGASSSSKNIKTPNAPKPVYNLQGERITFLVPQTEPGQPSLEEKLYAAFASAKNASLRPVPH